MGEAVAAVVVLAVAAVVVLAVLVADSHTSNNLDYDNSNNQKRLDKPVII
jgi:hypothetical protein